MHFWYSPAPSATALAGAAGPSQIHPQLLTVLWLAMFLLGAHVFSRVVPGIRKLAVPDALTAGGLGLLLGSSALNLISLDGDTLKLVVYHGGALIFLVLALRAPLKTTGERSVRSYAFAIPIIATIQALIGLGLVLGLGYHIGFGLMLPLGFSQGPGVALAMGEAWESTAGMPDGDQIGLMVSGLGFATCCLFGVAIFHLARRRGWLSEEISEATPDQSDDAELEPEAGDIDPLSFHLVLIGLVYLLTFGVLVGFTELIGDRPRIVAQLWGFHFLIALGLAVMCRKMLRKAGADQGIQDRTLDRIAGLVVDFTACAAISAVKLDLLAQYWLILSLMCILGALVTAAFCLWLARRAFHEQPFEEILVMFGALTGTLPTGLTLLRLADPEMKSPLARNYVMGSGASVVPAVVLLGLLPAIVAAPEQVGLWTGIMAAYALFLGVLWWKFGGLRFTRPLARIWPPQPIDPS